MIRLARHGDAAPIAALTTQLGYPTIPADMQSRLSFALASSFDAVFVDESPQGALLGWIHVMERRLLESPPFCEIMGLVVDEAARSRGVGAELTAAAERWAESRGVSAKRVRSNVVRERAHAFYVRLGYQEVKRQVVLNKPLGPAQGKGPDHAA